jgi:hypothetical protein
VPLERPKWLIQAMVRKPSGIFMPSQTFATML